MEDKTTSEDRTAPSDLIRKGATHAEVYNEGLMVYLYDEKNRQAIIERNGRSLVNILYSRTPEPEKEKQLAQFSRSALLVAYGLQGDGGVEVDVIVGEPLSPEEMRPVRGLKWHKPQTSRLSLPSGRLRIETGNSCRIG
ncbi:MAG TPA: hypothetical protein VFA71_14955 [Terriglobales bacterium]|nr:hypothetical protein [Terriglobales bacterium]